MPTVGASVISRDRERRREMIAKLQTLLRELNDFLREELVLLQRVQQRDGLRQGGRNMRKTASRRNRQKNAQTYRAAGRSLPDGITAPEIEAKIADIERKKEEVMRQIDRLRTPPSSPRSAGAMSGAAAAVMLLKDFGEGSLQRDVYEYASLSAKDQLDRYGAQWAIEFCRSFDQSHARRENIASKIVELQVCRSLGDIYKGDYLKGFCHLDVGRHDSRIYFKRDDVARAITIHYAGPKASGEAPEDQDFAKSLKDEIRS